MLAWGTRNSLQWQLTTSLKVFKQPKCTSETDIFIVKIWWQSRVQLEGLAVKTHRFRVYYRWDFIIHNLWISPGLLRLVKTRFNISTLGVAWHHIFFCKVEGKDLLFSLWVKEKSEKSQLPDAQRLFQSFQESSSYCSRFLVIYIKAVHFIYHILKGICQGCREAVKPSDEMNVIPEMVPAPNPVNLEDNSL